MELAERGTVEEEARERESMARCSLGISWSTEKAGQEGDRKPREGEERRPGVPFEKGREA